MTKREREIIGRLSRISVPRVSNPANIKGVVGFFKDSEVVERHTANIFEALLWGELDDAEDELCECESFIAQRKAENWE